MVLAEDGYWTFSFLFNFLFHGCDGEQSRWQRGCTWVCVCVYMLSRLLSVHKQIAKPWRIGEKCE